MENFDYEKAYKAVLQTATQWIKDGCTDRERICLECVFPELRESEDERMMRVISLALTDVPEERFTSLGTTLKDCLAYLEKQKEQKSAVSREGILHQLFQNGSITLSDYLYLTEEQKPVEIHNPTDEEVESWKNELTEFKKFATKQAKENQLHISYTRDVMWENFCSELLSFVNSRKPVEWSEEDQLNLNWVIAILNGEPCELDIQLESLISWLKSLRPSWKPSEEQMEELWNVISYIEQPGSNFLGVPALLESLYEELKKL